MIINLETVIIAVIAATPGILLHYVSLRKTKVQENHDLIDAYKEIIDPLKERIRELELSERELRSSQDTQDERIDCLEDKVKAKDEEISRLRAGADLLITQLRSIPMDPMWMP